MVEPEAPEGAARRPTDGRRPPSSTRGPQSIRALGGYVAIASLLVLGFAAQAVAAPAAPPTTPPGTVAQAQAGEALYVQTCAACHGPGGGGGSGGPDIRNAGAALTDLMLRSGRMPLAAPNLTDRRGPTQLTDDEIRALVAYVASLGQGPAIPNVVTEGADVAKGRQLYVANCAACHGPAAGGGAVGGGFVAPPLAPADATQIGEAALGGPGPMPRFSFTPEQLNELAAYVRALSDAPHPGGATSPAIGPVTEGFIACIALVLLLLVARWIAVRQRSGT
jgi:ubiquinol-cytochrome c reductase cytochrome c subunit